METGIFQTAVQEKLEAQDQLLDLMAAEGASETDIQHNINNNSHIQDAYNELIDKLQDPILSLTTYKLLLLVARLWTPNSR